MLNVAVKLRAPDTGQDTIAIETEIIELLSQAAQQAQSSASSAAQAQMMQMMMQMMQVPGAAGSTPGEGNQNPYLSESRNTDTHGDGTGQTSGERTTEQTQGRVSADLPVEFRSALEGYFNQVDDIEP